MRKRSKPFKVERLEKREMLDASDVIISEFLAVNDGSLRDEDGDASDWIELNNNGNEPVDLGGLILRDDTTLWTIPNVELEPSDSIVIFASGKDRVTGELHTNFKLANQGDRIALLTADGQNVIFEYDNYPFQTADVSYGVEMSTGQGLTLLPSEVPAKYHVPVNDDLGLSWTEVGFDDAAWNDGTTGLGYESSGSNYSPLLNTRVPIGTIGFYTRIAFDADDLGTVSQLTLQMKYDDGFIAYLNGQRIADGNGPEVPLFDSPSTAENSDGSAVQFEPFDISAFKNTLLPTGNVLAVHSLNRNSSSSDLLMMPEIEFARPGTTNVAEIGFFPTPTPNGANGIPVAGFTAPVVIDVPHGFYNEPQTVILTNPDAAATIRFTTDGSPPTADSGQVYTGPLTIDRTTVLRAAAFKGDLIPAEISTASYFFVADVVEQDRALTLAAGFPSSWNGTSADYGLDPDVIGPNDDFGGRYTESIKDDLKSIPTLSIVMDIDDMFGSNGIYANPGNSNLEEPASLELIHPDGSQGFQIDAGLKIQGGAFRSFGLTKKKSFRFKFQKQYGDAKLNYPLFGEGATDSFDTITLRMEANDGWQWSNGDNTNRLYSRDEFGRRTQLEMGQPASHGTFGHVYINGFYWGTYNIVERPDEGFASDYIGGDKEDWDIQNSGTAVNGNLQSWNDLNRIAQQIDRAPDGSEEQLALWMEMQGMLPDGAKHPDAEDLLDVENYIDYLIVNFYGGNSDWPHKNYYAGRQRGPDSTGYKFFMWDAEWSLNLRSSVNTNQTGNTNGIASVYGELRRVPEFQLWWADRVQKHFSPGGALYVDPDNPDWDPAHPERNRPAARFVEITDIMRSPLVAESARWGDQHGGPYTVDESWEPQVEFLLENYFPLRSERVLSQFRSAGLMSDTDTPTFSQYGGVVHDEPITLSATQGQVYYTTDGTDPRLPGGAVAPSAILYDGPVAIEGDTQIRMRALDGTTWSAIDEARFLNDAVPASVANLAITEIHFNPQAPQPGEPDIDSDEFEFIEVTNISETPINLDGVRFVETDVAGDTQGIRFTFDQQSLAPGASLVVVENLDAFHARYGTEIPIAAGRDQPLDPSGQYGGKLSNAGETITLQTAAGEEIRRVAYDDDFQIEADGTGPSLEVTDPTVTDAELLGTAALWRLSDVNGGTPGRYSISLRGDFNTDGQVSRADVDLLYAAIAAGEFTPALDLTGDGSVDNRDANLLIEEIMRIQAGDTDLDGDVDFADFLILSANFGKPSQNWLSGDFDGDEEVGFSDFLLLSAMFGT